MKMMIDKQYIEELVEKFMDGGTSLDEERMLYRYFSSDNIDESLLLWKDYFAAMGALQVPANETLKPNEVDVEPLKAKNVSLSRHVRLLRRFVAAAAIVIVLVVAAIGIDRSQNYCEAFVYGKKVTNKTAVMKEMNSTLKEIDATDQPTVDDQLKDVLM